MHVGEKAPPIPAVKICGITTPEDALAAVEAGAQAIGLQFTEDSLRSVSPQKAREIRKLIPPTVDVVGVFTHVTKETILGVAEYVGLDYVQLHGDSSLGKFPIPTIAVVRVKAAEDLQPAANLGGNMLLFDSKVEGKLGGTGQTFDWTILAGGAGRPFMLAGGLTPENVAKAIEITHPWAVDVSSGVEESPGRKSFSKMNSFVAAVKRTEPPHPKLSPL